jgi:septal ring factor EnvC (AmiA/AmiB activator)
MNNNEARLEDSGQRLEDAERRAPWRSAAAAAAAAAPAAAAARGGARGGRTYVVRTYELVQSIGSPGEFRRILGKAQRPDEHKVEVIDTVPGKDIVLEV